MFYIGQSFERTGNRVQAETWYKKIIALPVIEANGARAKALQSLEALEGQIGP
jgi:hypothetical protein